MELNRLKKLKKILLLSGALTLGATGCNNEVKDETAKITEYNTTEATKNNNTKTENTTIEPETEIETEPETETEEILKNSTVDNIIEQYIDLSGEMHSYSDFVIDRYDSLYLFAKDNKYVYNYHLGNSQDPKYVDGYTYIDDESISIYVVKVNEGTSEDYFYTPIAAMTEVDGEYHNVLVTTFDGTNDHEPSKHYIYLDETKENYNNLENGEEYLYSKSELVSEAYTKEKTLV